MLKIAHRGNTNGPSPRENHPFYIEEAISRGFDVEVDVWVVDKNLWLGHDKPQYMTSKTFLDRYKNKLWIHCKNLAALEYFVKLKTEYKHFWHENDDHTLTSNGLIWTYPGKPATDQSILVIKDLVLPADYMNAFGICSDYVSMYDDTVDSN
jgi:hypothetical protein